MNTHLNALMYSNISLFITLYSSQNDSCGFTDLSIKVCTLCIGVYNGPIRWWAYMLFVFIYRISWLLYRRRFFCGVSNWRNFDDARGNLWQDGAGNMSHPWYRFHELWKAGFYSYIADGNFDHFGSTVGTIASSYFLEYGLNKCLSIYFQ